MIKSGVPSGKAWSQTMTNCSVAAKQQVLACKNNVEALEKLIHTQNESVLSSKLAAAGMKLLATAGNMLIGLAITKGIELLVKGIDELANSTENCKERVNELLTDFNNSLDTAKSNAKTVEDLADRYEDLSKGVDNLGHNVSLTAEEYKEYNSIVNDIASMFPTMVQGYNDEGNAILTLKGNVESLRDAYKEAELAAYRTLLASEGSDDIFENWQNTQEVGFWSNLFDGHKIDVGKGISHKDAIEQLSAVADMTYEAYTELLHKAYTNPQMLSGVESEIVKMDGYLDQQLDLASNSIGANTSLTPQEYDTIRLKAKSIAQTLQAEVDTALSGIKTKANAYLNLSSDYQEMDADIKSVASMIVNSLDADIANEYGKDIGVYVEEVLNNLKNADVSEAYTKLFTVDTSEMSIEAAKNFIDDCIGTIVAYTGENPVDIKVQLGLTDYDALYNNLQTANDKASEKFTGDTESYDTTLSELNKFAEENSINTQDELAKWNKALEESRTIAEAMEKYKSDSSAEETFKSFFEVFTSETFADARESLLELAKAGELSPKTLETTKEYKELLKQTGLSANEAKDKIMGLLTTQQKLAGTSQGLDALKTAYQEAFNDDIGFVTAATLESLPDVFKNIEGYDFNLFKSVVGNTDSTKAEMQQAFNDIVTAYVNSQGVIESVLYGTEAEAQTVIDNLTQMGITNAEEVVTNARNSADTYNMIYAKTEQAYIAYLNSKTELENAQLAGADKNHIEALTKKSADDKKYYEDLVSNNQDAILKGFGQDYLDDYDNWCDTLEAKASAYNEYIKEYMKGYEQQVALHNGLATMDPFYYEHYVLGKGKNVPLLNVDYGKKLTLDLGGKNSLKFDSPNLLDGVNNGSSKDSSEETFDWIKVAIEQIQRTITNLGKTVDATYKKWATRNTALASQISAVNKEISVQRQAYQAYMAEANSVGLSKTYRTLVQNGKMDIQTITDEKLADKIKKYEEYYNLAIGCQDAILDLENELASLARKQFDHVVSEYEDKLSSIEHEVSMIDGMISQVETRGYLVSAKYYGELIEKEQGNLSTLKAEYNALNKALAEAMNTGNIDKYSESWYEMTAQINDVEKAIQDSNTALIEYQNSIRDLRWEAFDKMMDMMGEIQEESDFLRELMSEHKMFDDKGGITDKGQATMGLRTVDYNSYMAQAESYRDELLLINKDLANDPNNQTLLERRNELLDAQREAILAAQEEKQAIKDLYSEGYDNFLNHMGEIIDKRKEFNSLQKDALDYQRDIEEQTKNIASLEKQLNAYGTDTSEATQATVQKIKVQLEEAKQNLEETEYEKFINDQEALYDSLQTETENFINARLDNIDGLLQSAVDATNANAESIQETLSNEAAQVGTTLSDAMNGIWSAGGTFASVVDVYQQNFSGLMTTTNSILSDIKATLLGMVDASDKEATKNLNTGSSSGGVGSSSSGSNSSGGNSSSSSSSSSSNKNSGSPSSGTWGSWFVPKKFSGNKSKLNINTSLVDRLKKNDFDYSFAVRKQYYSAMGGEGSYTGSSKQNSWMIKQMSAHGFKHGGTIGSLIKGTGEDGFVLARTGEEILSLEKIKQLQEVFNTITPLTSSIQHLPNVRALSANRGSYEINIGDIQMYGVNDPETFAYQLKDNLLHNSSVRKIIQADTLGMAMGKNSFTKFNY